VTAPVVVRRIVGVTGCPGAGKSTYAAAWADAVGPSAVVVPMDGFHLAQAELVRLGRADRKGAPDTFDVAGYVALLRRLRDEADRAVYAPAFRREIEEPVAGAIAVEPHHALVVTEGNYLLHDADGWERVRSQLEECRYLELDDALRRERLVARHVAHGRSDAAARAWVERVDEPNAVVVAATRWRADRIVQPGDGTVDV
jgi:pantothenate kinase